MDKFVEEIMLKRSTLPFENTSAVYRPTVRCFSADCWFFVGQLSVVCRPTVPLLSADCWPALGSRLLIVFRL